MQDHTKPTPDEDAEDIVLALFASFDPKTHEAAMLRRGGTWTEQEHDNARLRSLMLTTLDPADGTPEADELAAIFGRQDEYATVKYGEDGRG